MLDSLVLIEPSRVISNADYPGSWKPVGQHFLICKPIDLVLQSRLATSTESRNRNNAGPLISSLNVYLGYRSF